MLNFIFFIRSLNVPKPFLLLLLLYFIALLLVGVVLLPVNVW